MQRFTVSEALSALEAWVMLALASCLIKWVPFRWIARRLGTLHKITDPSEREDGHATASAPALSSQMIPSLRRALDRATRRAPWAPSCLPRAMAMHWMLSRRRISSDLVLGVRPTFLRVSAGGNQDNHMQRVSVTDRTAAHAWVVVLDHVVVGQSKHRNFSPIVRFRS